MKALETLRVLVLATIAGLVLGVGDLWALSRLPAPWAELANSSAGWATGAFLLGVVLRTDPVRAGVGGIVMMLVAIESYYAFAEVFGFYGFASPRSPHALEWMQIGVVAGLVFGVAGAWAGGPVRWQQVTGVVVGTVGVLLGASVLGTTL